MAKQVSEWSGKIVKRLNQDLDENEGVFIGATECRYIREALDAAAEEVAKVAYSQMGYAVEGRDWLVSDSENMFVQRVLDKLGRG